MVSLKGGNRAYVDCFVMGVVLLGAKASVLGRRRAGALSSEGEGGEISQTASRKVSIWTMPFCPMTFTHPCPVERPR